jgi:hypothetical protein
MGIYLVVLSQLARAELQTSCCTHVPVCCIRNNLKCETKALMIFLVDPRLRVRGQVQVTVIGLGIDSF